MDYHREFKKEVVDVARTCELFNSHKTFQILYIKFTYRTRLTYRVLKKLRTYKKVPIIEAVETIIEEDRIEVVNTIKKELKPVYSIKIRCKIQIHDWALDIIGFIDTGCSNTILDKKLVPLQYHQTISPAA